MNILFVVKDIDIELIGIGILSSILKRAGYKVNMVKARYALIKQNLSDKDFTVLAYSAVWSNIDYYLSLNRRIKEEFKGKVFSVFGGPQATCYPEEIINVPGVDGVCIGEGDYALLELADNLRDNKSLRALPGWWIKQDGRLFRDSSERRVEDLDSLPFADRSLFLNHDTIFTITSRGCPYECSFCVGKTKFRRRSVDNVIKELKEVKSKTNPRFVHFGDLTFNISCEWLKEFSEKYKKDVALPFYCFVRADLVTLESTQYLKDAGCFSMGMGVESANDYLRNEVLKKGITQAQIISASRIIKSSKIRLMTFNMLGIPHGTLEDDLDTIKLNIQCRADYAKVIIFYPYKNTEIYALLAKDPGLSDYLKLSPKEYYQYWDSCSRNSNVLKINNLHKLFPIAVGFPFLFPLLRLLIALRLNCLYAFLNFFWTGYLRYCRVYNGNLFLLCKNFLKNNKLK